MRGCCADAVGFSLACCFLRVVIWFVWLVYVVAVGSNTRLDFKGT